jgi:hypothetical protein
MPEIKNTFVGAKMDKDTDSRLLAEGSFRNALNLRIGNSESSDAGAGENSLSNRKLTNLTMGANPFTLGMFGDEFEEKLYWFVKTDTGNYVFEWDNVNAVASYVLIDTRSGTDNVLNFDEDYLITGVNVLIDADNGDRYLLWTDGKDGNEPRQINIERAKSYGANNFGQAEISLYKAPPLAPPVITLTDTASDEENNLAEKFLTFSYRYKYLDGEYSALSPFTDFAFRPKPFFYDYSISSNESMINRFSAVDVAFNTGSDLVKAIEIVFKESGSNAVYAIESFNKDKKGWGDNTTVSFLYSNSKIKRVLNTDELNRLYDNVPLVAYAQEMIGNRILYANYKENIDLLDSNGDKVGVDLTLTKVSTAISEGVPTETMRTNRDYEVAIAYLYGGGRLTTPLTSEGNTLYIRNSEAINKNQLKVAVANEAPELAEGFRFFIKQSKTDYDTIIPTLFYQDGTYVWIKLEANEMDKISEGEFIYVKADTSSILTNVVQTKVLEIKTQDRNFLEDTVTTDLIQLQGNYFKIKPIGFRMNEEDFFNYEFDSYDSSSNSNNDPIRNNISYVEDPIAYGLDVSNDMTVTGGITYTGVIDVRYRIDIDTQGTPDTFKWSKDDGASYEATGVAITGATQVLDDGIEITFGTTTGHDIDDYWVVGAKSNMDNGIGGDERSKAYAFYKGIGIGDNPNVDIIEGGARITITYSEFKNTSEFVQESFISSRRYENLEEWFYGDNIQLQLGISDGRIWFRRGDIESDLIFGIYPSQAKYITIDPTKQMNMIIRTTGTQNNDAETQVKVNSSISIFQSENDIIFETKPFDDNLDIFYEIGKTYQVSNGLHIANGANDVSQTTSTPGEFILDIFNSFAWGNAFESYKIKDLFNAKTMKMDTRPSSPIEDYKQNYRISSITYSGVFEQTTGVNALNEFNLSLANYKDLDDVYGKIKKLYSRDNDIISFQEDKVVKVLFNKSVLYNADGSGNISQTIDVLGQEIPYTGEYGISDNPESFARYGSTIWFADSKRGSIMRLSQDGLTEISAYGMGDYFRDDSINSPNSVRLGAYDPYFGQYVITLGNQPTLAPLEIGCGGNIYKTGQITPFTYILKLNNLSGDVVTNYIITEGTANVSVTFNGTVYTDLGVSGAGDVTFTRDSMILDEVTVTITPTVTPLEYSVSHVCPLGSQMKIVTIILNDEGEVGQTMTSRYKWNTSSFYSDTPVFLTGGVTLYREEVGTQGVGGFPIDGATINMQAYKDYINSGDFNAAESNSLSYLISSVDYTSADIATIQGFATYPAITTTNEDGIPETNEVSFVMNRPVGDEILYLIYDYTSVAITIDTYINIYFDSSGSMNSTLTPLQTMRDTLLQDALLPFYDNDPVLYASRVNVISNPSEQTIDMLDFTGTYPVGASNVVSLVFQDEANAIYQAIPFDSAVKTATYDTDIATFRASLASFAPAFYRGVVFQVDESGGALNFQNFIKAVELGTSAYAGASGLSDKTEVIYKYNIVDGGTAGYYLTQVTDALIELGFDLTP